ncbi:MAG TPA: response regulator [Candidatus Thiothrix moscowensis]|uniref:response regulator n=1 Tax=unclassified Thiothrix TaxID=2636184 RepID=UPI0025F62021|nr:MULTISPECIES: response regulator [unclassified Thiothrix]HRJ52932.1 response regulator [Candidatus Thiothrix moscowensis]
MLATKSTTIGICLFDLPDKDQAVIQRVITFGSSQGKPYAQHPQVEGAHIVIALDNISLPATNALTIRIGDAGIHPSDLILQRPLLVTRVMRALDDAAHLLQTRPVVEQTDPTSESLVPEIQAVITTAHQDQETNTGIIPEQTQHLEIPPTAPVSVAIPVPETPAASTASPPAPVEEAPVASQAATTPPANTENGQETLQILPTVSPDAATEEEYSYLALVVDDSAAIRKQLEIELRNAQIKADFAESGEEALEKSTQKQYDLVFLDIIMPGIDGYEVCRQMRSRKTMKKTPIIMLSGKTSPLDEVQGVIAGASTYLTKPVKHEQFQQTLKRVSKWLTEFAR